MYAVVDIETTGGFAGGHGITEIGIVVYDGADIVETFETLINPGLYIPKHITALTGIDNDMVADAPSFEEVAEQVYSLLKDRVFIAHNVNFDYSFVAGQLKQCGYELNTRRLCTVRLSRKILPGLPSYSLSSLCSSLGIEQKIKHRAMADTVAALEVFKQLQLNDAENFITQSLKRNSGEFNLPAHLDRKEFDAVPEHCGVYYFLNEKNEVVYVGKAANLKKRVKQHFSGNKASETKQGFIKEIHHINFEVCGNELVALLLEDAEIKRLWPKYNRAQKKIRFAYGLFDYTDQQGFIRLGIDHMRRGAKPLIRFGTEGEARNHLMNKVLQFGLCPKMCSLDTSASTGCHALINPNCKAGCRLEENRDSYNQRVQQFIDALQEEKPSYVLIDKGRNENEYALVWVEEGTCRGFGFADRETPIQSKDEIEQYILPKKPTLDWGVIVNSYLRRRPLMKRIIFN